MVSLIINVLQPLISRYQILWRCAEMVADWTVFLLSFLCCQCVNYLPCGMPLDAVDGLSDPSDAYQIIYQKPNVNEPGTSKEALITQHSYLEESEIIDQNSRTFLKHHPELEGMILEPDQMPVLKDYPEPAVENTRPKDTRDYPVIHTSKHTITKGSPKKARADAASEHFR